jgi:hypothetical protein
MENCPEAPKSSHRYNVYLICQWRKSKSDFGMTFILTDVTCFLLVTLPHSGRKFLGILAATITVLLVLQDQSIHKKMLAELKKK